jgi:hypothetical protein
MRSDSYQKGISWFMSHRAQLAYGVLYGSTKVRDRPSVTEKQATLTGASVRTMYHFAHDTYLTSIFLTEYVLLDLLRLS